jgi:hypothetical protein
MLIYLLENRVHQVLHLAKGISSGELVNGSLSQLQDSLTLAQSSASASQESISFFAAAARSPHMASRE